MPKSIIEVTIRTPVESFLIRLPLTGHEYTDSLVLDSAFEEAHLVLKRYYANKEEAKDGKSNPRRN